MHLQILVIRARTSIYTLVSIQRGDTISAANQMRGEPQEGGDGRDCSAQHVIVPAHSVVLRSGDNHLHTYIHTKIQTYIYTYKDIIRSR